MQKELGLAIGGNMAKRFTDTEKWRDEWFGSLSNDYRMIWLYLLDTCSIAGIWKKDFRGLNFNCNTNISENEFLKVFEGRIIDKGNFFFLMKFLRFQYPKGLNSEKPAIVSVRKELHLNNLSIMVNKSLGNDYLIIKDKDKDKDKEEEEDKDKFKDEIDFSKPDIEGDEIVFPLDTQPVRDIWARWKESRYKNHGARYKMMGEQAALKRLQGMNYQQIESTILAAISGGWSNLYPDKTGNNGKQNGAFKNEHPAQAAARAFAERVGGKSN